MHALCQPSWLQAGQGGPPAPSCRLPHEVRLNFWMLLKVESDTYTTSRPGGEGAMEIPSAGTRTQHTMSQHWLTLASDAAQEAHRAGAAFCAHGHKVEEAKAHLGI